MARGVTHYLAGRVNEAIADYTQALGIDAKLAPSYFNRGSAYSRKQMNAEAIADYRKALDLDPSLTQARDKLRELGVLFPLSTTSRTIERLILRG